MFLGIVYMLTNRVAEGIAECHQAIALDRNLADAHAIIGWAKFLLRFGHHWRHRPGRAAGHRAGRDVVGSHHGPRLAARRRGDRTPGDPRRHQVPEAGRGTHDPAVVEPVRPGNAHRPRRGVPDHRGHSRGGQRPRRHRPREHRIAWCSGRAGCWHDESGEPASGRRQRVLAGGACRPALPGRWSWQAHCWRPSSTSPGGGGAWWPRPRLMQRLDRARSPR